jgi:hypothetical protein
MRTRRLLPPTAIALATILLACSGAATGPSAPAAAPDASPTPVAPSPATPPAGSVADTLVTTFTINPGTATTRVLGEHKVQFPADAVCDPATSSYGPGTWDAPCAPLGRGQKVTVTARSYTTAEGEPRVDFAPALRFVPAADKAVVLSLKHKPNAAGPQPASDNAAILYCPDASACVDEALADETLVTQADLKGGFLFRRIKHFSGYSVGVGRRER